MKLFSLLLVFIFGLVSCGGGDSSEPVVVSPPPTPPIAFNNLPDIALLENNSETLAIALNIGTASSYELEQTNDIKLGLSIDGDNLRITAPEVSQNEKVYVDISAKDQSGATLVKDGFYVTIQNDTGALIAPDYNGLSIGNNAVTETASWRVEHFGLHRDVVEPYSLDYLVCYPTPDDANACDIPETAYPETTNYAVGDFTGNGHQDLIVAVYITPHVAPRPETQSSYLLFFENDTQGNLVLNNNLIPDRVDLNRFSLYRLEAADLNGDGVDDLVVSGGYRVTETPAEELGKYINEPEPIVMLLSDNGKLVDASDRLDIELGEGRNFNQRAIAIGDITGNGHPDIFISRAIVQNNGDGSFTEVTGDYFTDHDRWGGEPYSTEIGDFTGDGFNEVVVLNAVPLDEGVPHSFVLISTTGDGDLRLQSNPQRLYLPEPTWGDNGRVNESAMGKLINEYPGEQIVIADTRTDPYYNGRMLRMYAYSDGALVDLTHRIVGNDVRSGSGDIDYVSGEGMVRLLDFNKDGLLDIVDTTAGSKGCFPVSACIKGISVFLNNGEGYFHYTPMDDLAVILRSELAGYESNDQNFDFLEAFPIDLGHAEGYELLTRVQTLPQESLNPGDTHKLIYYMLKRKKDGLPEQQ